ncbi:hypothetical protein [Ekhidna sp. To15]|uniref:hypothetical protein n=1 Tax=Ekhidna sp. To15 TaxID=3395267 RepID=UPI003F52367A
MTLIIALISVAGIVIPNTYQFFELNRSDLRVSVNKKAKRAKIFIREIDTETDSRLFEVWISFKTGLHIKNAGKTKGFITGIDYSFLESIQGRLDSYTPFYRNDTIIEAYPNNVDLVMIQLENKVAEHSVSAGDSTFKAKIPDEWIKDTLYLRSIVRIIDSEGLESNLIDTTKFNFEHIFTYNN